MFDSAGWNLAECWAGFPWQLRVGTAVVILGLTTLLYWLECIPFRPALIGWAVGGPLFLFGWPSDSERKGYRF